MRRSILMLVFLFAACGGSDSDKASDTGASQDTLIPADSLPEVSPTDAGPETKADTGPDTPVAQGPLRIVHAFPPATPAGGELEWTFQAEGGAPPYGDWQVVQGKLPAGTVLDPETGTWAGTPEDGGVHYFVVQVTDADQDVASDLFGIRIGDPGDAGPLSRRAAEYQEVYEARHLWHGLSLGAQTPDDPDGDYQLCTYGDAAFVSGQCTMAMAYRFAVEGTPEALDTVTQQVDGWRFFQRMTGVGIIGRGFAHETDPSQDGQWGTWYPDNNKHEGVGEFQGWYWQADTSRDQVTGAMIGVAAAYDLVDDEQVRDTARTFLTEMMDHVLENDLKLVDPDGEMTQHGDLDGEVLEGWPFPNGLNAVCLLAWFKMAAHATGEDRFKDKYEELVYERDYPGIMRDAMWVYMGYQTKWYNTYMAIENFFHLMRLEEDPDLADIYRDIFRDTIWLNTDDKTPNRKAIKEHNPTKTTWYLYSTGERDPVALYHALWQIVVFPEAPLRDKHMNNSADPSIEINPDKPDEAMYPLPAYLHKPDMVMWHRNPYELDGGADNGEERTGCDYLLPYWMGRYYGYISKDW